MLCNFTKIQTQHVDFILGFQSIRVLLIATVMRRWIARAVYGLL